MQEEFAPQYSLAERLRFVAIGAVGGAVLILGGKAWFFPWLHGFAIHAACTEWLGIEGTAWLFYGMFVGPPVVLLMPLAVMVFRRGGRILRDGQVPPIGEKSLHLTRIKRGPRVRVLGRLHRWFLVLPLLITLWGAVQAHRFIEKQPEGRAHCRADLALR